MVHSHSSTLRRANGLAESKRRDRHNAGIVQPGCRSSIFVDGLVYQASDLLLLRYPTVTASAFPPPNLNSLLRRRTPTVAEQCGPAASSPSLDPHAPFQMLAKSPYSSWSARKRQPACVLLASRDKVRNGVDKWRRHSGRSRRMNKLAGETRAVSGVPRVWVQLKSCNYSPAQQPCCRFDRFRAIDRQTGSKGLSGLASG
jgi:hypothetical protein